MARKLRFKSSWYAPWTGGGHPFSERKQKAKCAVDDCMYLTDSRMNLCSKHRRHAPDHLRAQASRAAQGEDFAKVDEVLKQIAEYFRSKK